ncbi:MAG: ribonuclease E/G, partial [Myxococcota bacterium]
MAKNTLLINVDVGETRVALIENGILAELYVERKRDRSPVGNVYVGRVTRVLPGMQAAFIDIGLDRAAFLHVEDVLPHGHDPTTQTEESNGEAAEPEAEKTNGKARKRRSRKAQKRASRQVPIRDVLKEGQLLTVQVSKGSIGTKGARVTSHIALPGRYVVYVPDLDHVGVSKRIGNDQERRRLKEVIEAIKPPQGGVIVRTLAAGLTKKKLKADIGYLVRTWEQALGDKSKVEKRAPALLYEDLDITLRAARDLFDEDVEKIIVDDPAEYDRLREFLSTFLPERVEDVECYEGEEPFFDEYGIEDEIARALGRKVPLTSGGYLIIDQAEALTAIDVSTGRFTGKG